jgi:hypothetical protein
LSTSPRKPEITDCVRYINFFTNIFPARSDTFPVTFVIRNILAGRVCCVGLFCFNHLRRFGHYIYHPLKNGIFSAICTRYIEMLRLNLISSFIYVVV